MEFEKIIDNDKKPIYGSLIKNKQFITYLTKKINYNYMVRGKEISFPAPQPVSIEKKDFAKLKDYIYNVGLKLNGVRFLIYFLKDKNEKKQCILINRALNFYVISMDADETIYNGTLLDGELIYNEEENNWDFIVHDGIMLCGNKINKLIHSIRLEDTKMCLKSFIKDSETNTIKMSVKEFYTFDNFDNFIENVYNKSCNNDGIIFMPEKLPVISGTQYSMLKWKPQNKHTFDFQLKICNLGMEVYVYHEMKLIKFANIHKETNEGKEFIEKSNKLNGYKEDCIIECEFNKETNNFNPLLIRTDKTHPNSLRTIERTLFNINENITIDDFKTIDKSIYNNKTNIIENI